MIPVLKFYANSIHEPAISDIFPVVLHAGSLGVLISLHCGYLKPSI